MGDVSKNFNEIDLFCRACFLHDVSYVQNQALALNFRAYYHRGHG